MRKFKFIIFILLIIGGYFISSENFQDYLSAFENANDYATVYAQPSVGNQEMIDDLLHAANEVEICFFVSSYSNASNFDANKTIFYSSEKVIDEIKEKYGIEEKSYKSILCGKTAVVFQDIQTIPDLPSYNCLWLMGSRENQKQFKSMLMEKYAGSIPREGSSVDGVSRHCIFMWAMLFAVSAIFSLYQIVSDKKESVLRTIYGESLGIYIGKSILLDSVVYIVLFGLISAMMSVVCYTGFCIKAVLLLLVVFLIINASLYLTMLKSNLRKDLSKSKHNTQSLILCYVMKVAVSVLTISSITVNGSVILKSVEFASQRAFFQKNANKSFVRNFVKFSEYTEENDIINANYKYDFYQHFTGENKAFVQAYFGNVESDNKTYPIVYLNKNNLPYLLECIPEIKADAFSEDKVYYIFPKSAANSANYEQILHDADDWVRWNLEMHYHYEYEYSVLNYQKKSKLLVFSNQFDLGSDYIKNPIIAFNNRDESKDSYEITSDIRDVFDQDIMYLVSDEEIITQEEQSGYRPEQFFLEVYNVYDNYQNNLLVVSRMGYINSVISVLVIVMNIILTALIVSMEYSINKIELAVKKTVGFSRFERFRKLYVISIVTTAIGTMTFLGINIFWNLTSNTLILLCGIGILLLDALVILLFTKRADIDQIHKVLNGG